MLVIRPATEEECSISEKYSVSNIDHNCKCSLSHYFHYNMRLRTPDAGPMAFGRAAHDTAAQVALGTISTVQETQEFLEKAFVEELGKGVPKMDKYSLFWLQNRGIKRKFAEEILRRVLSYNILKVEEHFQYMVSDTESGLSFFLHGYIDAVTTDNRIVEYKFSARRMKDPEGSHTMQVGVYAAILGNMERPVVVEIVAFPKLKTQVDSQAFAILVSPKQQRMAMTLASTAVTRIRQGLVYPNRTIANSYCSYCSYSRVCLKYIQGEYLNLGA